MIQRSPRRWVRRYDRDGHRSHAGSTGTIVPPNHTDIETQLARLEAQLDQLRKQVRQAQQVTSMGSAAPIIAHEVNNLLTPFVGYAQTALSSEDVALMKKALGLAIKHSGMIVSMTDRVLNISAAAAPRPQPVNVRQVIDEAIDCLCRDLEKDRIRLCVDVAAGCTVWADPLQFQQVIFNLCLNARDAMLKQDGEGHLTIRARTAGSRVAIEVANSGDPIPKAMLPVVFEPYQTTKDDTQRDRPRCSGIGLALCRELIEENNGEIRVTSDAKRTCFIIHLPTEGSSSSEPER